MAFNFTPKSEDELKREFENLPDGEYPFTVLESGVVKSKSKKNPGRPFIKVKLNVHGPNYNRHVYDQFADWFGAWKMKHFAEVTNLRDEFSLGALAPENNAWAGREGYCKITTKKDPIHGDKNEVVDYLPDEDQKIESVKPETRVDPETARREPSKVREAINAPEPVDDVPF